MELVPTCRLVLRSSMSHENEEAGYVCNLEIDCQKAFATSEATLLIASLKFPYTKSSR